MFAMTAILTLIPLNVVIVADAGGSEDFLVWVRRLPVHVPTAGCTTQKR